jgi:hypothetical protein
MARPARAFTRGQQARIIRDAARRNGISARTVWGVFGTETNFGKGTRRSSAGAVGDLQFLPSTARSMHIDPLDFKQAADGAARYLKQFKGRGLAGMLSAYNAGPGGAIQPQYVRSVRQNAKTFPSKVGGSTSDMAGGGGGGGGAVTSTRGLPQPGGTGAADLLSALIAPPTPRVPSGLGLPEPAFSARSRVPMPQTPLKLDVPSSGAPEPPRDFNSLLNLATTVQGGDVPHTTVSGGSGGGVSVGGVPSAGTGRVKVAGSANRAGHGIQRGTMRFLERVAGAAGETITVGTGTNHNRLTVDGNVSDHWDGHAGDIPVPVDSGQGDHIAAAALVSAGVPERRARAMAQRGGLYTLNWHGHRIQVIWKTNQGGNHHNHVHVSFR